VKRNLLFLLLSILLFMKYGEPTKKDIEYLKGELTLLNTKISKESWILKEKRNLMKELKKQEKKAEENRKKLFSSNLNNSIALGKVQNYIKKIAEDSGMDFVSSNWGEPIEKDRYIKLPISFILRGYPANVDTFLKKLYSWNKLLKIETITIGKFNRQKLVLNFTIFAFKLEKKSEPQNNR
jgi:Tfp pilus assembly protein PilO